MDANRRRRKLLREQQIARANALATATSQGAQSGSALPGAYGSIQGETNTAISGVNQNEYLGNRVFEGNRQAAQGQSQAALGGAITSVGGAVLQNRGAIQRVGQYLGG